MGAAAGFGNLWAGATGYGLAAGCPWWPTGLGLFGTVASLGQAAFIAAVFSLARRKLFAQRFGTSYYYGLAAGFLGLGLYLAAILESNRGLWSGSRSFIESVVLRAQHSVDQRPAAPVMWTSVVLWLYLIFRLLLPRGRKWNPGFLTPLVILTARSQCLPGDGSTGGIWASGPGRGSRWWLL